MPRKPVDLSAQRDDEFWTESMLPELEAAADAVMARHGRRPPTPPPSAIVVEPPPSFFELSLPDQFRALAQLPVSQPLVDRVVELQAEIRAPVIADQVAALRSRLLAEGVTDRDADRALAVALDLRRLPAVRAREALAQLPTLRSVTPPADYDRDGVTRRR